MTIAATYEITVVGPAGGVYYLGYYSQSAAKFFVIEPFANGDLAQATAYRMNQQREN